MRCRVARGRAGVACAGDIDIIYRVSAVPSRRVHERELVSLVVVTGYCLHLIADVLLMRNPRTVIDKEYFLLVQFF